VIIITKERIILQYGPKESISLMRYEKDLFKMMIEVLASSESAMKFTEFRKKFKKLYHSVKEERGLPKYLNDEKFMKILFMSRGAKLIKPKGKVSSYRVLKIHQVPHTIVRIIELTIPRRKEEQFAES